MLAPGATVVPLNCIVRPGNTLAPDVKLYAGVITVTVAGCVSPLTVPVTPVIVPVHGATNTIEPLRLVPDCVRTQLIAQPNWFSRPPVHVAAMF